MATVLITGGTGVIGKALTGLLVQKGHQIIVLTRKPKAAEGAVQYQVWNVAEKVFPVSVLQQTDYVVHLAGANVGEGRWTTHRKEELLHSRTDSSHLLTDALRHNPNRVKAVVSASAIGWYGPDTEKPFVESDPSYPDFLGNICKAWEASIGPVTTLGKRLAIIRTGLVLDRDSGTYPAFLTPIKMGVAPVLGSGKQMMSWIHLQDICRIYLHAIENHDIAGVYNAVAPQPVTNKEMALTMAHIRKGKFFVPVHVPPFLLKAALGEMSVEVLKSCTVDSAKIRGTGFQFVYPRLQEALADLMRSKKDRSG